MASFSYILGLGLCGIAFLCLYGIFLIRKNDPRPMQICDGQMAMSLVIPDDDPVLESLREIVRIHVHVLSQQRRLLVVPDHYGVVCQEEWDRETSHFIQHVVIPHIETRVPEAHRRKSFGRMLRQAKRSVPNIALDNLAAGVFRYIIESEISDYDVTQPEALQADSHLNKLGESEE